MKRLLPHLKNLHNWANKHEALLLLLTLLLLLRLPNLTEPYWYGDEAIYLTLGTGMRHGLLLYKQIIDHKTPLIYYLAMVPNQLSFRILLIAWMMTTSIFFHSLAKRFFNAKTAFFSTLAFIIVTTLPAFEGNIPNGELFVMGFIIVALWILGRTPWLDRLLQRHEKVVPLSKRDYKLIALSGIIASLGILTKVPAILDVGSLAALMLFATLRQLPRKDKRQLIVDLLKSWLVFGIAVMVPIIGSVLYYIIRGSFADYLEFGLLYNLHYTGNWTLPFTQPILLKLFTLPGKLSIVLAALIAGLLISLKKKTDAAATWMMFWSWAALFAALLSNRPYPHYFQQVFPPLTLALTALFAKKTSHWSRVLIGASFGAMLGALVLLQFQPFAVVGYYQSYFKLVSGQISRTAYADSFNSLVAQNRALETTIVTQTQPTDRIFIWGTDPMLYAESGRSPATRFTVAFHIEDLGVYSQTMDEIRANKPKFIAVMKAERDLPGLNDYLQQHYIWVQETSDIVLYRLSSLPNLELIQ